MDIPGKSAARQRLIKRIVLSVTGIAVLVAITMGMKRLKPAAPTVERSTVWIDAVKRGPMDRDVRGLGTLVPEETLLIPATTDRHQRGSCYRATGRRESENGPAPRRA